MLRHNRQTMKTALLSIINLHADRQCRAYLVADAERREAALIDARFDLVPLYLDALRRENLKLRYAIDTHTHADHLSGSDRLRNILGCKVVMSGATRNKVPDLLARDDDEFELGRAALRFLHTPGHTPDSMCVMAGDTLLTGDTLFIGGSARTDFMGGSASALFDSFRRIEALGPDVEVLPGHDYNQKVRTTIGEELISNSAFRERNRQALIRRLDVPGPLPNNMSEMLAFNAHAGIAERAIIRAQEVRGLGVSGRDYTVVDVRNANEFEAGRIEGAKHIPLPDFDARLGELEGVRRPLLFVCKAGVRATLAMMAARRAGLSDLLLLEGGMEAYTAARQPMVADTGKTPAVVAPISMGPAAACAAGGSCSSAVEVLSHSWSEWVI